MTDQAPKLVPVLLTGGAGTRLWPLSRETYPKQFLPVLDGGQTPLQATWRRVAPLAQAPAVLVSNEQYRFIVAEQGRLAGMADPLIILEPAGRNTAPAIALAALELTAQHDDALMLVLPSDHAVADEEAFRAAVAAARPAAEQGRLVTFGVVPAYAETGYGYIRAVQGVAGQRVLPIQAFVEKPDAPTAQSYVDSGEYYWNSGMFLMRASRYLQALAEHRPDILEACRKAMATPRRDGDFLRVDAAAFEACPADSIDYAVMERSDQTSVVPMQAGWSDIGSWAALWQIGERDERGNALSGDVIAEDCSNLYAYSSRRLVAALGVHDLVVVETPDAVLVAARDRVQEVRKLVDRLRAAKRSEATTHRKVYRPWGYYDGIDDGTRFQVKRIVVHPGARLSLQMHHHRAEHWIVVKGTARVTRGDESFLLTENQSTYIPLGVQHRLENPGAIALELIEVQSGSYLGEDDIVRFEDVYGR